MDKFLLDDDKKRVQTRFFVVPTLDSLNLHFTFYFEYLFKWDIAESMYFLRGAAIGKKRRYKIVPSLFKPFIVVFVHYFLVF